MDSQPIDSMFTLQDKLGWQHTYQECLEKLDVLKATAGNEQAPTTADHASQAQSLASQRLAKELSDLETLAQQLESKHKLEERWTADSFDYQSKALQRKCYNVHRLQRKIETDVDWLRWVALAVSHNPCQRRGTSTQLKKKTQDARARLPQSVQELQDWHAVHGDIGDLGYDVMSIKAEDMQQPSWKAPWSTVGTPQTAQQLEVAQLLQLQERCAEELQILKREAQDMVSFYSKQQTDLLSAIEVGRQGSSELAAAACPLKQVEISVARTAPWQPNRLAQRELFDK